MMMLKIDNNNVITHILNEKKSKIAIIEMVTGHCYRHKRQIYKNLVTKQLII